MMNLQCCVLMPFDPEYDWVYETIRNATQCAVDGVSIACRRADEARRSEQIDQRIVNAIRSAHFVIADATGANRNVMWELVSCHDTRVRDGVRDAGDPARPERQSAPVQYRTL